jgi:hypothetical protein
MQQSLAETAANAGEVVAIVGFPGRKREEHEVFELTSGNAAQQTGLSVLDGEDAHPFGKPNFRELQSQIIGKIVGCVPISQKVGIKPNDEGLVR